MAQTPEGAIKALASRIGTTPDEVVARRAAGEKWCWSCQGWRAKTDFGREAGRPDGLATRCGACRRVKVRKPTTGRPSAMKGRSFSPEARANMGRAPGFSSEKKGLPRSLEDRAAISAGTRSSPNLRKGPDCPGYIDGRSAERRDERGGPAGRQWAYDVKARDRFTCQDCGDARGGNLHAHHIRPFATHPALRLDLSNGVTLCESCHIERHRSGNL